MEYRITASVFGISMILNSLFRLYGFLINRSISSQDTRAIFVSNMADFLFFLSIIFYFFHFYRISTPHPFGIGLAKYGRNVLITILLAVLVFSAVFYLGNISFGTVVTLIGPIAFYTVIVQPLRMKPVSREEKFMRFATILPILGYILPIFSTFFFFVTYSTLNFPLGLYFGLITVIALVFPGSFIYSLYRLSKWKSTLNGYDVNYDLLYRQPEIEELIDP